MYRIDYTNTILILTLCKDCNNVILTLLLSLLCIFFFLFVVATLKGPKWKGLLSPAADMHGTRNT